MAPTHTDVLIIGAGLSAISAAYHLQTRCPERSFLLLEARGTLGGTWDLFRYPGIRSDSDMYTLGFSFRPWTNPKAIADGPSILAYIRETAEAYGIDKKIRYHHKVEHAHWSSEDNRWSVTVRNTETDTTDDFTCNFLFVAAGYYNYDKGFTPDFPGLAEYKGTFLHPQHWPEDLDYAGKRVVVIGSGATAVTLVPAMAEKAEHVTMLQRSPTYIVTMPARDVVADALRASLPAETAYAITRWKNVLFTMGTYMLTRRYPKESKAFLMRGVKKAVGDSTDVEKHFNPKYNPWDQRMCLVPDGDLFASLKSGKASITTDTIETFTEDGIRLASGETLKADIIVSATGLQLQFMGGATLDIDGKPVELSKLMVYKGMMCSDVPNLAFAVGYTNASWTLKCDLTSEYVCRLLNHMKAKGYTRCVPRRADGSVTEEPLLDFSSGYVLRALDRLPRQGSIAPWKLYQNYALDRMTLRHAALDDGVMAFS